jgi:hypothetical protein
LPVPNEDGRTEPGFFTDELKPEGVDVHENAIGFRKLMLQLFREPVSGAALSETNNCQVPFGFTPLNALKAAEALTPVSGTKVPVNEAEAAEIKLVAVGVKVVLIKLSPPLPLRFDSVRYLPSGATNLMIRFPSKV